MRKRVRIVVHGRVHGVGFRAYAATTASRLGITGSVRNCDNGTVEIVAEGDQAALDKLLAWCRIGPSMARVDRVDVDAVDMSDPAPGSGFHVL